MNSKISKEMPIMYETPQVSGANKAQAEAANSKVGSETVRSSENISNVNNSAMKIPSAYEAQQKKLSIESDLDSLIKQIMPDLGVQFKIHENTGQIITKVVNNDTDEVVREFPAEKILDLIHNMCQKLGVFVNKKL